MDTFLKWWKVPKYGWDCRNLQICDWSCWKCGKLKRGKCFPHVGIDFEDMLVNSDAYSEPRQTTTYIFPTITKGIHLLTIFAKISMLDIWQGFECASKGGSPFNNCESRDCKIRSLNMRSISFCSRPHVFTSFWRLKKKFNWLEPFFSRWRMMTSKQIKHKRTSMCDVSN